MTGEKIRVVVEENGRGIHALTADQKVMEDALARLASQDILIGKLKERIRGLEAYICRQERRWDHLKEDVTGFAGSDIYRSATNPYNVVLLKMTDLEEEGNVLNNCAQETSQVES